MNAVGRGVGAATCPSADQAGLLGHWAQAPSTAGLSLWGGFGPEDLGLCLETFLVVTTRCSWHVVGRG